MVRGSLVWMNTVVGGRLVVVAVVVLAAVAVVVVAGVVLVVVVAGVVVVVAVVVEVVAGVAVGAGVVVVLVSGRVGASVVGLALVFCCTVVVVTVFGSVVARTPLVVASVSSAGVALREAVEGVVMDTVVSLRLSLVTVALLAVRKTRVDPDGVAVADDFNVEMVLVVGDPLMVDTVLVLFEAALDRTGSVVFH